VPERPAEDQPGNRDQENAYGADGPA
jgi:hypothetical protein